MGVTKKLKYQINIENVPRTFTVSIFTFEIVAPCVNYYSSSKVRLLVSES